MNTRKLIQFGRNSHVVSVPKRWVLKHKLTKGDDLVVTEKGDRVELTLATPSSPEQPSIAVIQADGKELGLLSLEIVSSYLRNYDTIIIHGKRIEDSKAIKQIIRNLPGLEIHSRRGGLSDLPV